MKTAPVTLIALAVTCCCLISASVAGDENKIKVDVYYESLCSDSIYFITKELAPAFNHPEVKKFLKVNLVPFGKASWSVGDGAQPVQFHCQHGEKECYGNKAQSCALDEIQKNVSDGDEKQQKSVDVVNCAMSNSSPDTAVPQCAQNVGLGPDAVQRITACTEGQEGTDLLIKNGEKTFKVQKPLTFVPTVIINGENNQGAFRSFGKVICDLIQGEKPSVCANY
ncbi:hypothetical protein QAD02_022295 [Eretmocerus hayati]|uniref:Uncharacterized protein n=1 Tax=Eretmocerus hayati TaxID=131215 RepID=A0ACC2PUQ1_9HYME|nr:hypothetical protein QAD02_022295 [Eretmocerus hayati]